jgi:DNA-binding XRE family transcriptional regulator
LSEIETVTLSRADYDALISRQEELEDLLAAREADDGSRIPHEVFLKVMNGENPVAAWRAYRGMTLRSLAEKTGLANGYLSEIERGLKTGSVKTLNHIAEALDTKIETLME